MFQFVTGMSYPQLHICMAGTYRFRLRVCACEREWGQGGALFVDKRGTREGERERPAPTQQNSGNP